MKQFILQVFIFILFGLKPLASQAQDNSFEYSDSCLEIGAKKIIVPSFNRCYKPYASPIHPTYDSIYTFLSTKKSIIVELSYHTDSRGSAVYNLKLSQRRMDELKKELIRRGIDSTRIVAKGYGETKPIIPEEEILKLSKADMEKAHHLNRRMEIIIRDHTFNLSDTIFFCGAVFREQIDINDCKPSMHPGYYLEMDSIYNFLIKNESITLEIGCHTDQRGSAAFNKKYSKNKADIIVNHLLGKGLDPKRIVGVGYGESMPLIKEEEIRQMKTTAERERLYSKNRRVDFKILKIQ